LFRALAIISLLALGGWQSYCVPPPGYYDSAQGKTGAALRTVLHLIVHNHRVIPYSSGTFTTREALKVLDQDPADTNNVLCLYSRLSETKASFGASAGWNREHCWCNSYGIDSKGPAYSDLHHLRAEDYNVNSARGNKYYDVSNVASPNYKQPATPESPLVSTDTDSWEPPDMVKGDIARALLYMAVRYTGDPTNEPHLVLTDNTALIVSTNSFMGRYTTLLKWHFSDPVDAAEQTRNDGVYACQNNRNPFVDHPEWVAAAFIPPLTLARSGTNVLLRWPADYAPSVAPQETTNVLTGWHSLTNPPALGSNTWQVALPLAPGSHYFRLRLE